MPDQQHEVHALERLGGAIVTFGLGVAQTATVIMMVLISTEVIARNVFSVSLLISDEFSGYLLVIMSFFGIAYSLRSGALLRIEFILLALSPRLRAMVDVIYDVLAIGVSAVLFYAVIVFTWSTWERHMVAPTLIETPLWIPELAMPFGCLILIIGFLLELRGSIRRLITGAPPPPEVKPELEVIS